MAVSVSASLKALVTGTELASYLNQTYADLTDARKDDLLRIINVVGQAIEEHLRSPVIKAEATEYYDGGRPKIILRRAPVDTSATFTVIEDGTTLTKAADGTDETAAGASPDYWLIPDTGLIERNGIWQEGRRIIKVTYTAGHGVQYQDSSSTLRTTTAQTLHSVSAPDDMREACLMICKRLTDLGPVAYGTEMVEGGGGVPSAWPPLARKLLGYHRHYA